MFKALFTHAARSASLTNIGFDIKNLCRVFPQNNEGCSEYFAKLIESCYLSIEHGASESDVSHSMAKAVSYAKTTGASEDDIKELCAFAISLMRAIATKNQTLIDRLDDDISSFFVERTGAPLSDEHIIKVFRKYGFKGK